LAFYNYLSLTLRRPCNLYRIYSSLPELEEKVCKEIFKGDWDVMEKLMTEGASARLEEYALRSVTNHTRAKFPRKYFQSIGRYFVKPEKFDLVLT
jgi:hypothetical protein